MKDILQKINPVHLPTCDEWMKIAGIVNVNSPTRVFANSLEVRAIQLQSCFEELTRGKWEIVGKFHPEKEQIWQPALLKKEHVVCEFQKPEDSDRKYYSETASSTTFHTEEYNKDLATYTTAQSKVWLVHKEGKLPNSMYYNTPMWEWFKMIEGNGEWNWTKNFINQLLK